MTALRRAAVLGYPISHSLSPVLHGYWLQHYHLAGSYEAIETKPEDLAIRLKTLQDAGYAGVNLTVPLKETVLPLLDEITPLAAQMGAVNTVVFKDGKTIGYNTDAEGFARNIAPMNFSALQKAIVLGAGGAARAVIAALVAEGAQHIIILNRSMEKAEALSALHPQICQVQPWEARDAALAEADLLVNTTSLGMKNQPELVINLAALPRTALVTDIVYNPLHTALLQAAAQRGNPTVDGLGMLLYQAVPAFEHFFGIRPEVTEELRRYIYSEEKW
jgi:shikimate dehydrogenase